MFYIDDFNRDENVSYEDAIRLVNNRNHKGNLLDNMEYLRGVLLNRIDDEDFYDDWCYEINAYNKVFTEMKKLFGDK